MRVPLSVPVNYICARASSGACSGTPVNRHTLTHRDHTRHTQSARGGQLSLLLAGSRGSARPAQSLRRKVVVRPQAGPTPMPVVRFSIPRLRTACRGAPTRPQRLGGQEEQGGGGVKDLRLARAAHAPSGEPARGAAERTHQSYPENGGTSIMHLCWVFTSPRTAPKLSIHNSRTTSTAPERRRR